MWRQILVEFALPGPRFTNRTWVVYILLVLAAATCPPTTVSAQVPPKEPDSHPERPQVPPKEPDPHVAPATVPEGEWSFWGKLEIDGSLRRLTTQNEQPAEVVDSHRLFRGDLIEYNEETGMVHAQGHVFFRDFEREDRIWADRVDYDTDREMGVFYNVRGETRPRIVVRPGVLASNNPYYFEGERAERNKDRYILYNGWITNCPIPDPWWRLRGSRFDIVPDDRAISHRSIFVVKNVPVFYTPYFYHSMEKEPRKSGFLTPNAGLSKRSPGPMIGIGYFWAINRSSDATYRVQDFTGRGFTHHIDYRARPNDRTDFGAIFYGVDDRQGDPNTGDPKNKIPKDKYSGYSLYAVGHTDLGHGWTARGTFSYVSSFRFRRVWTESFNERIGGEIWSSGFITKSWSSYTVNGVFSRLQNFQSDEQVQTNPITGEKTYVANKVTIRKVPELEFAVRPRQFQKKIPLWFSMDSTDGLLYRSEPIYDENGTIIDHFRTRQFVNRIHLAPHVSTALHLGALNIVPSAGIRETLYGESQTQVLGVDRVVGTNIVRSAREASVDFILPSLARVFDKKTVFGDKLKHVIEPRVTYRYVTGVGEDFDRFIRFDETELISDTNELELSLTNRLYAKRGDSVDEIFTWQLRQKRYFNTDFGGALIEGRRNVFESTSDLTAYAFLVGPRSTSPVASTVRASPIPNLGIQWQADYDPRAKAVVDSAVSADYRFGTYTISAGHNQVHNNPLLIPPANQFRGRFAIGDANRRGINAAFDAVYDYRTGIISYVTGQVTYNTDCCGLSVQYRSSNVNVPGEKGDFRVAFSIANIGSFGTLRKQDRMF